MGSPYFNKTYTMKKTLLVCAATIALVSCNKEELARQQRTIDSLNQIVALRDSTNNDITKTLQEINESLSTIKDQEGITSVDLDENSNNPAKNDLQAIYNRLQENKKKITNLQRRLNSEMGKNKQYDELIAKLQANLDSKIAEIEALTQDNQSKDKRISTLETAVNNLSQSIDSLTQVNQNILSNLDETVNKLNTRYYIVEKKSDLKDKGLLQTSLFKGKKATISESALKKYFNKIDMRKVGSIALNGKKCEVLTQHPESSYSIDEDYTQLTIKDKDAFWSQSNCLVISTK